MIQFISVVIACARADACLGAAVGRGLLGPKSNSGWGRLAVVVATGTLTFGSAPAIAQIAQRSEIPIREVILSDGEHRYAVPITVAGVQMEAGLDTGSTGLRILPGVVPAASEQRSGRHATYSYDSGTQFSGDIVEADVTIGAAGRIRFQQIDKVGCRSGSACPAARVKTEQFGIQGSGLPNEGFKAILGINMAADDTPNPLMQLGVMRWIVELPRPGEPAPGRLILNPSEAEVADYKIFPIDGQFRSEHGGLHDAISGCLINQNTKRSFCGPMDLDTGAPGIQVGLRDAPAPWEPKTPAMMVFTDKGKPVIAAQLTLGEGPGLRMTMRPQPNAPPGTRIFLGIAPYFAFSALYEPQARAIGLKPR